MKVTYLAALMMANAPMSYAAEDVVDLGDMEIVEEGQAQNSAKSAPLYDSYDPVDSGLAIISEESINNSRTGGTDTTELLRRMPGVQLDKSSQQAAGKRDIQSIRPKDFTISGGPIYGNNVQIDGISMNSLHDVYQPTSENDENGIYGQTSQTLYVNPDLLGSVEVYDSNISARYGEFSGGVVNYEVRQPKREFGFKFSTEFQNDSMVRYHKPQFDDPDDEKDLEDPANFSKSNSSVTFDIPVTEKLRTMLSYSYSESSVDYQKGSEYGGDKYDNGDTNQNFLVKAVYDYRDDLTLEGQIIYSPYDSERDLPNRRDDHMVSQSSGLQTYIKASGYKGNSDWMSKLAYSNNDSSR
ncbi:MAG: TonB-dependent receptor plug domain-containing protein, partial [Vibrio sp.]